MFDYSFGFIYEFWPWMISWSTLFVDHYFGRWLDWLLPFNFRKTIWVSFLILFIILPALFVIYIYITVISLFVFRRRHSILTTVKSVFENTRGASVWDGFIEVTCQWWCLHAQVWHSYQVHGEQKLIELHQEKKGCLIVYYHGGLPVDVYYFVTWFRNKYRILVRSVVDHFMFKVPGFAPMLDLFGATSGPRSKLIALLKEGQTIIISPGGVREALFSKDYEILWGDRTGFAQCAIEAGVPIIPMFTSNIRQTFDFPDRMKGRTLRMIYEKTRLPLSIIFGGFPAKLDTYFGDAIETQNRSPVAVRDEVKSEIQNLIKKYQYCPNDWWKALVYSLRLRLYK